MSVAAAMVHQLRLLCGSHAADTLVDSLTNSLTDLVRDVAVTVPSSLTASVTLVRHGEQVTVTVHAAGSDTATPAPRALASVAMPLAPPGSLLVLRAAVAGAFLVLTGDLALGPWSAQDPLVFDEHLGVPTEPAQGASALHDIRAIDRVIGLLLEQGVPPDEGLARLSGRAREADLSLGALCRTLLPPGPPGPPGPPDPPGRRATREALGEPDDS